MRNAQITGRFVPAGLFLLVLLCSILAPAGAASPLFQNLQSGEFVTIDDYREPGKWLVVMIWAHDCRVCEEEVEAYHRFHQRHAGSDALVLGVSLDGADGEARAREFVARHGLAFDNLIGEPETVAAYYQVATASRWVGTPSFMIFGPNGELRAKQAGAVEVEIVENFIAASE